MQNNPFEVGSSSNNHRSDLSSVGSPKKKSSAGIIIFIIVLFIAIRIVLPLALNLIFNRNVSEPPPSDPNPSVTPGNDDDKGNPNISIDFLNPDSYEITLDQDDLTSCRQQDEYTGYDCELIDLGNKVEPGLYTIIFTPTNPEANTEYSFLEFKLNLENYLDFEQEPNATNYFPYFPTPIETLRIENVPIQDNSFLGLHDVDSNFKLEFIPQDDYYQFVNNGKQMGFYPVEVAINSGKYRAISTKGNELVGEVIPTSYAEYKTDEDSFGLYVENKEDVVLEPGQIYVHYDSNDLLSHKPSKL